MSDFTKARIDMVEGQLRTSGVFDARVLAAFSAIPREAFLLPEKKIFAYSDAEQKIWDSPLRIMSAAAPIARLIELAEISPDDVVLDIGSANGYTCAILSRLASSVVGVESEEKLVNQADEILSQLDIPNAAVIRGELGKGAPAEAPFDVIVIGGAVEEVPQDLLDQLRVGGKLVALIGKGASAVAVLHTKNETGFARVKSFNACLPDLAEFAKPKQFTL